MQNSVRRALLPSFEILLLVLVFYLSLAFMPDMLNSDGDLGRHLTVGKFILDTQQIPTLDLFSHTRFDAPFVPHEWLSELLYAASLVVAGLNGVAWLTALLIALTYFVLAVGLRALGIYAPLAFLAAFFAYFTGLIHHLARPHLFSLLFFTIEILLLELYRRRGDWRLLLPLPLLMVAWANLHGAFILGIALPAFFGVGALLEREWRAAKIYFGLIVVLLLASLVNPVGLTTLIHGFGYVESRLLVDLTVEYQSPDFHNAATYPFAALIALSLLFGARNLLRANWTHTLLLVGWTMLALYSARNIPLYAQVAMLILIPPLENFLKTRAPRTTRVLQNFDALAPVASGWVIGIAVIVGLILFQAQGARYDVRGTGNAFRVGYFPVAAVDSIENQLPQGEMFNEFTWGGYLLYRLHPHKRVFIDGQTDFYGEALTRDYLQILGAEGDWRAKLAQHNVTWVIVPPTRPLAIELMRSEDWLELYRDANAGIWARVPE